MKVNDGPFGDLTRCGEFDTARSKQVNAVGKKKKLESRSAAEKSRQSFDLKTISLKECNNRFAIQDFNLHKKRRFVALGMASFAQFYSHQTRYLMDVSNVCFEKQLRTRKIATVGNFPLN